MGSRNGKIKNKRSSNQYTDNDRNDRYYRKEIREQDRNHEQQQSRNYEYNYERQNNF